MSISRKQLLLAAGLFLSASSALASAPLSTGFYVGGSSGASFVTNQATGHLGLRVDTTVAQGEGYDRNVGDDVHAVYKEESSIRGYNGGAFVGWNFYCDESWFHAVELSGDFFSNRGQYAFDLAYVRELSSVDVDVRAANFKDVYDLEFALNLAFKPGAKINDSTVLFGILGASWGRFDSEIERIRHRDSNYVRTPAAVDALAVAHNDNDRRGHHHDEDQTQDLWGFVLGAGVSTQITHYLSAFASYQYTYYGTVDLDKERSRERTREDDSSSRVNVRISDRSSIVDTNIFKVGIAFNF